MNDYNQTQIIGGSNNHIILIIFIILIIGAIMGFLSKRNKETDNEVEIIEEKKYDYANLEEELAKKYSAEGIEWNKNNGIYSIYLSCLKELVNKILENIDEDIEKIFSDFKEKRCRKIKDIDLSLDINKISEPINLAIYFQEEEINGVNLKNKIQKLAKKYCEKAVNRVREKISVELKYNNKEGIKKVLEEMKEEL